MREKLGRFLFRHGAVVRGLCRLGFGGSMLLVCVLSLLPVDGLPDIEMSDKLGHFIAYAEITTLGLLGFRGAGATMVVIVGEITLGGALEIAQLFVPGRSGDMLDFAVDCLGVAAGFLLARLLLQLWPRPSPKIPDQTA